MMTAASLLRQTNPVAKLTAKYRQKQKLLFLRLSDTTLLAMFFLLCQITGAFRAHQGLKQVLCHLMASGFTDGLTECLYFRPQWGEGMLITVNN